MTPMTAYEQEGSWDSIHVFETAERGRQAHYKLTSTVMLQLLTRKGTDNDELGKSYTDSKGPEGWKREGEVSLSGSMTRQVCEIVGLGQICQLFGTTLSHVMWVNLWKTNTEFSTDRTGLAHT